MEPMKDKGERTKAGSPIPQSPIRNPSGLEAPPAQRPQSKRIGLFGGTFNPIHLGHLRAGVEIQEAFDLNPILFIPTAIPPHKQARNLLSFDSRLEMIRLAIAGYPFFKVSDVEKQRKGKSYSIQTLRFFKRTFGPEFQLYFIIGLDAFLEINTWREFKELFALCHFIVMDRPGYRKGWVKALLHEEISAHCIYYPKENRFLLPGGFSVYLFSITLMDISSTRIRNLRETSQPIRYLVPDKVENYILEKGLYAS